MGLQLLVGLRRFRLAKYFFMLLWKRWILPQVWGWLGLESEDG